MKSAALLLSSSMLTATISMPLALSLGAMLSRSGSSFLHGSHHEAQKSTRTTLPRSDDSLSDEPDSVAPSKSLAGCPALTSARADVVAASIRAAARDSGKRM